MNPAFTGLEAVAEPLRIEGHPRQECYERALAVMEQLGISSEWMNRPSLTFSGGQRQRLALARALVLKPKLLILDEALAGLDIPTQAQIVRLLLELRRSLALSYLFITHDLCMAACVSDSIAVLDHGTIVEMGSAKDLYMNPQCEETRELVAAIPELPKNVGEFSDPV